MVKESNKKGKKSCYKWRYIQSTPNVGVEKENESFQVGFFCRLSHVIELFDQNILRDCLPKIMQILLPK